MVIPMFQIEPRQMQPVDAEQGKTQEHRGVTEEPEDFSPVHTEMSCSEFICASKEVNFVAYQPESRGFAFVSISAQILLTIVVMWIL
jgi:hypothetical protein